MKEVTKFWRAKFQSFIPLRISASIKSDPEKILPLFENEPEFYPTLSECIEWLLIRDGLAAHRCNIATDTQLPTNSPKHENLQYRNAERGAAIIELMIGCCILFFLLFSVIDLGFLIGRRVLAADALRTAAIHGSRVMANCTGEADAKFYAEVAKQSLIRSNHVSVNSVIENRQMTTSAGGPLTEHGLRMNLTAQFPCGMFCNFVMNGIWLSKQNSSGSNYTTSIYIPIEDQNTCL